MYNVQLPGSKTFHSQILMHSSTQNIDVSLAKQFQKHQSNDHQKHRVIDKGKYIKRFSKRKCTYREYHVQDNDDIAHNDVKFIVIQKNSQQYHYFVHIQSLMAQRV